MEILIGSVWQLATNQDIKIRTILIQPNVDEIYFYPLSLDRKKISKPSFASLKAFIDLVDNRTYLSCNFPIPPIMLLAEEQLTLEAIGTRNERFALIKDLLINPNFLIEFASSGRSRIISKHARLQDVPVQTIYRILRDYFRYGMTINALTPLRTSQGGAGKSRSITPSKRGRPIAPSQCGFEVDEGVNISGEDKSRIKQGYLEFFANNQQRSVNQAYRDTISKYYAFETLQSKSVPTYGQFKYWGKMLTDKTKINISRKPKGDFERNQRGMTQSVHASANIPGKVFEIDCTPADVHIVYTLNRNRSIGKPFIYSVTDRASRMIVGFYICLENPSWDSARLAILHAFTPKVEYAKRFGVEITENDWPCHHLPETLMGDRGEMKGKKPGEIIPTLGVSLELAPPFRPDFKSIVEGRFKLINSESLHNLPGTTKGRMRQRVEVDPRQEAVLTLYEITAILIRDVIKHNNYHQFNELITDDLVLADLPPCPRNFWNLHIANHTHCLRKKSVSELKALLLPPVQAKVTKYGIKYKEIYYTCELAETQNWYSLARTEKEWEVEGRFDQNNIWEIYIRPDKYSDFVVCNITSKSRFYSKLHYPDILYMSEWKKDKVKDKGRQWAELENFEARTAIVENAIAEQKLLGEPNTKIEKTKDLREYRRNEIALRAPISSGEQKDKVVVAFPGQATSTPFVPSVDYELFTRLWENQEDD